ncbi:NUDIX domain-containing protein [Niveispirillum sp. KHB5.9]|uniref:NUDIX domain-containing protein n=1 Tax=Niveispirillum sp. KHB5.9 TaxID=3400269 RepID=UPI003A889633
MSIADRIRIQDVTLLSDDWYVLKKTRFDYRRADGTWQRLSRETYDRGNGATILLYDPDRRTVVLTRQFRFPAFVNGHDDLLTEAPAGLLDGADPADRIRRELAEETGYVIGTPQRLFDAFMSPGSVTERLHFFAAPYHPNDRQGPGGGNVEEGEEISVLEISIDEALASIRDGKTICLLLYASLYLMPRVGTE